MTMKEFLDKVAARNPGEPEFLQAVEEVVETVWDTYISNPRFVKANVLERIVEPDRTFIFRVPWVDDEGNVRVNRGYRVQYNGAIGPYKGGIRFHPSVNLSILKFLGFEQIFKNSLTSLPMGGGKGGADFDAQGRSEGEMMRFSQSYMLELFRHLGPDTDVPAGDIGVGRREVGYMFGMYKKLTNEHTGVITGKGLNWGGSIMRPEATGFGIIYFCEEQLKEAGTSLKGKTVAISGFGQVAWGAVKKANELGAKVVTISGPDGYIYDEEGIAGEKIDYMLEMRNSNRNRAQDYSDKFPSAKFYAGQKPWEVKVDVAIPCATQNELNLDDAKKLIANGVMCLTEGANMPCTPEAVHEFQKAKIIFGPGKAANAGGVATSGLEMTQNAMHLSWGADEVNEKLFSIMVNIHKTCVEYGRQEDGSINYVKGANIAGFVKVAETMCDLGVV
ncbi:MAG: NADP-specific glutamate dehydrogenase [Candidatus Cloacimonadales bacterium]|nr:NADP-specific glutamate dehydrogenase [Candidatus Cloacimonadota bacterium]MDD3500811.1 NADP-specific glutamate dehydrogenase [Candidatus Cloacimonadota bacterium]MDX9977287.1 NADP-specific glutamate dehydrogenase [Candidatus Cloacimonadales bacterium]